MKQESELPPAAEAGTIEAGKGVTGSSTKEPSIGPLRVIVYRDEEVWYAQGLDVDYMVEGDSLEQVEGRIQEGLMITAEANMERGTVDWWRRRGPDSAWDKFFVGRLCLVKEYGPIRGLPFTTIRLFGDADDAQMAPHQKQVITFLHRAISSLKFTELLHFVERNGFRLTLAGQARNWTAAIRHDGTLTYEAGSNSPHYALANALAKFLLAEQKDFHDYGVRKES